MVYLTLDTSGATVTKKTEALEKIPMKTYRGLTKEGQFFVNEKRILMRGTSMSQRRCRGGDR